MNISKCVTYHFSHSYSRKKFSRSHLVFASQFQKELFFFFASGTPWTEEEHRMFLLGLQKLGKGDWRGISRNFVVSRTPTQVASHAQKYFIRQTNSSRRKRRSSLFDMVPEMVCCFLLVIILYFRWHILTIHFHPNICASLCSQWTSPQLM